MFMAASEISKRKFGKLRIKIPQDIKSGSNKKIEWICDCGRKKLIKINYVLSGHTKSCGNCNQITTEEISKRKFGKLRIKKPTNIMLGSGEKIEWICDCGNLVVIPIYRVASGHALSCGKCNLISATEISKRKFGKLRIKIPQDIKSGSNKKITWICDCGREKLIKIAKVFFNQIISCGNCNLISAEEISKRKFGKLRIKTPQDIIPGSHKKIWWICDCEREKLIQIDYVLLNKTVSCGQCNLITVSEIASKKFGKLRIKVPKDILPRSNKKIAWICSCGQEIVTRIADVLSNHTVSCGNCSNIVENWYFNNRKYLRRLKCPIIPNSIPVGGVVPLETIYHTNKSFPAKCCLCNNKYFPRFNDIRSGKSLTCGCVSYKISMPVIQITNYIKSLGFEAQNEYKVNKLAYDIFVPQKNLLIEFQGTRWHLMKGAKERDMKKKQNAIQSGYEFMEILEKDWKIKMLRLFNANCS